MGVPDRVAPTIVLRLEGSGDAIAATLPGFNRPGRIVSSLAVV